MQLFKLLTTESDPELSVQACFFPQRRDQICFLFLKKATLGDGACELV